jgi:subtilase family serine protease
MKRIRLLGAVVAVALSMGAGAVAIAPPATASSLSFRHVCAPATPGHATCFAIRVSGSQHLSPSAGPAGYHPADLADAYLLDSTQGTGQTIAIVDAFDDPNAESDLAVYRSTFGLPACTTANGCFRKVNQNGLASPLPGSDVGWAGEISLDVDMASAICPLCHILLVEATSASFSNLDTAENTAAALNATEISNSFGGAEGGGGVDNAYKHPGIPTTVSTGDNGFAAGPQSPANQSTVTAVGGTSLKLKNGNWSETVWKGAGSGCSTTIKKPKWQHDPLCSKRMIGDVSAVADPNTGVTIYDTFGDSGFLVYGGTSASAPIIAGVYALAGNGSTIKNASHIYANTAHLFDITKGSNGSCGGTYFCKAAPGYDGPTGNGVPNGSAAF